MGFVWVFPEKRRKEQHKMKKKILTAAVCAAAVLGFAGCGNNEVSSTASTSSTDSKNTVESTTESTTSSISTSEAISSEPESSSSESDPEESSAPSEPTVNEDDYHWYYQTENNGYRHITSYSYKGSDENVVVPVNTGRHAGFDGRKLQK